MTLTFTPKMGLVKPDGNEIIPNFPAQNAFNMDTLDGKGLRINDSKKGWRHLIEDSFSGVSSLTINWPAGTYELLRLYINITDATVTDHLNLRFNGSTATTYFQTIYLQDVTGVVDTLVQDASGVNGFIRFGALATASDVFIETTIVRLNNDTPRLYSAFSYGTNTSTTTRHGNAWGGWSGTNISLTSLVILPASGTVSGLYSLEGFVL